MRLPREIASSVLNLPLLDRWTHESAKRDGDSTPERCCPGVRQSASRRRAEETAHHYLKQIVDRLPDGLLVFDGAGNCTISNPASVQILGRDPTVDSLPGSDVESPAVRSLRSGEVVRNEQFVVRNPSTLQDVAVVASSAPLRDVDGHIAGAVLGLRDISVATAAEREKEQLLQSLTHILEGVSDAIVALDSSGWITRVNTAAVALLGRPRDEVVGRAARDVFQWEDEAGRIVEEEEYLFAGTTPAKAHVTADNRYYRKPDGTRIPVEISATLVTDRHAHVAMVVQVIRDMTRVRERAAVKDQILSLVSHELRTPIAHIKGFTSSMLQPDITWDAATQREFLSDIDGEADRLSGLVTDLLDMSRIEAGLPVAEMLELSPAALTWRAFHEVHWAISDHDVSVDVPDDLPDVMGNSAHLERVLGNLLQNAAKYSNPGSRIAVQANVADLAARWCVTDHGPGIPTDYRERIFDKFVRVPNGRRTNGIGLGLPICKGIVEAHGGRLWLESPAGGGCKFIFTIPLARSHAPA